MENREGKLADYSNLDIIKIFGNCHSVSEVAHAGTIFLYLLNEVGVIHYKQRNLIFSRMEIRKRQLKR